MSVNWPIKRLGDLCTRITVGHVGPMANEYVDNGIPFLRSQDIQPFRIVDGGSKFITSEFHAKLKKSELRAGDVAIVRTGFPGTAAVVPQRLDRSNCADLVIATPGPDLNPWFLACVLNSAWGKGAVSGVLVGVAQQHFNVGAAKEMRFRCPPIDIQDRIADILSAYDDLIENNTRRIAILEDMARRLFEEWFGAYCVPPVGDQAPELPEGWTNATLSNWVTDLRDPVNPNSLDPSTPYVGLEHLPRRSTTLCETGSASDVGSTKLKYQRGDILFGKIRPYFHKVAVMPGEGVCSSDAIVMRPKTPDHLPMALGLTSSDAFVAHATQASNGTKMPRADWKVLKNYPLPIPDTDTLNKYNVTAGPNIRLAAALAASNTNLCATRDMLLPKLISGEIEVRSAEKALEAAAA